MTSFNVGLGLSHVLTPTLLLSANTWVRQDRVDYFPSANLFSDQPATLSQSRRGSRAPVSEPTSRIRMADTQRKLGFRSRSLRCPKHSAPA